MYLSPCSKFLKAMLWLTKAEVFEDAPFISKPNNLNIMPTEMSIFLGQITVKIQHFIFKALCQLDGGIENPIRHFAERSFIHPTNQWAHILCQHHAPTSRQLFICILSVWTSVGVLLHLTLAWNRSSFPSEEDVKLLFVTFTGSSWTWWQNLTNTPQWNTLQGCNWIWVTFGADSAPTRRRRTPASRGGVSQNQLKMISSKNPFDVHQRIAKRALFETDIDKVLRVLQRKV